MVRGDDSSLGIMRKTTKTGGYDAVIPRFPLVQLITFEFGAFYHELVDVAAPPASLPQVKAMKR